MIIPFQGAMAILGFAGVLYAAYSVIDFLALHFILPSRPLKSYKRQGSEPTYAVITGSSAGIGFGIAKELVRQGFGVVLIGHLPDELETAKATLQRETPGAAVRVITSDARTASAADLKAIVKSLEGLQVSILVNNVGGNAIELPAFRELHTYTCEDVDAVMNQNARFMARFTALMLPLLFKKTQGSDERSLIISMSSGAVIGLPYLSMYAATKAFNLSFSRSLSREFASNPATAHVDSIAIIPGEVLSQGNCRGVPGHAPLANDYGRILVGTVDNAIKRKRTELSPYWVHDIEIGILPLLPEGLKRQELIKISKAKQSAWDEFYAKTQ